MSGLIGCDPHGAILASVRADAASGVGDSCSNGACHAPLNAPPTEPCQPSAARLLEARARARHEEWKLDVLKNPPE